MAVKLFSSREDGKFFARLTRLMFSGDTAGNRLSPTSAILLILFQQQIFEVFLQNSAAVRIAIASLMLFPIGFFMGMPFPLGILAIEKKPRGAIAWAWAMNGLFTVTGGILSVVLSIYYGFQMTLLIAMMIYVLAWVLYARLKNSAA